MSRSTETIEIVDTAPRARRATALAMYAVCIAGVVLALALTVTEAVNGEPVRVSDTTDDEADGVITIEADVTNHTDVDRCPQIRAAARDTESRDLSEVIAEPVVGDGRLGPDETERYRAVIDTLTEDELDEELDEVTLYVYEPDRCEDP